MVWKEGDRKGLKVGDKVIPTKEFLEKVTNDPFEAVIDRWVPTYGDKSMADLCYLKYTKSNVSSNLKDVFGMSTYWLQKDPCVTCALGIEGACIKAEE